MIETNSILELLLESGKVINSEVELEKVVQRVTDIGTELTGARFGAFFYNVLNERGENFLLYTISGASKEAFSKFPNPRNTKIFSPTFTGEGTVRYDDVTKQPHYGKNPPHHGMPKGHLPVRSYLATPVISPFTKEVIGGLFFGHEDVGIFTEESEKIIEGIAVQAAIAMGNARLFEEKKHIEKILLEQKEQYKSIFNATSDAILIYNESGIIVEVNPSACSLFGYRYEEMIGKHGGLLFRNALDFDALKEIALSGRQHADRNDRVRKDGTIFKVEFKGSHFLFGGKPHVLSVVKEIEPHPDAQSVLEHKELANIISNTAPVTLWMTNSLGENIYVNQTWFDWVGGRAEDHLGFGWLRAVVPEDRHIAREKFMGAFESRKVFSMDFRIRRRNGEIRWCSTNGSPYYQNGTFGGFSGSLSDITDRKSAEEQLEKQNNLFNTVTNNTRQALFLIDNKQFCTYMNPAAELMTGYTVEELKEKPLHYYIHHTYADGNHYPIEKCPIANGLPANDNIRGEEMFIHRNGSFFPVSYIASPIIENNIYKGYVLEVRDISDEKKLQQELRDKEKEAMALLEHKVKERTSELERSNYELMQFTSVASHDLKEPARKISVFGGRLKEKHEHELDESSAKYLNSIIVSSKRMAGLIDDLLAFSRLSHIDKAFTTVDLNQVLSTILEDLEIPIAEKQAEIEVDNMPVLEGIPVQLGQVFQNLLSNSLKFCDPHRSLRIGITCKAIEKDNKKWFRIDYTDNGIGFSRDQAEKIFQIFYRLHARDVYEGTGVGLAIAKKIITLHKGTIEARGNENNGAQFIICLPEKQH